MEILSMIVIMCYINILKCFIVVIYIYNHKELTLINTKVPF